MKCLLSFTALFCLAACHGSPLPAQSPNDVKAPPPTAPVVQPRPQIDACSLITNEEVGKIQSATITDARSSETSDGVFPISQCYYASQEPNMSVSFTLTEPNPSSSAHPREYFERVFGDADKENGEAKEEEEKKKAKGREREEEEERKVPPRKIEGVGEEAFWTGNRFGGALYVLKKDMILRISVGGPDKEEEKINKSKALAEKAMSRL